METVKKISSYWGLKGKKKWIGKYRGFLGQWNILYDTTKVDTCHYTFVKTHRVYDTKSEP